MLDAVNKPIGVGDEVAFPVLSYRTAELRLGVIREIGVDVYRGNTYEWAKCFSHKTRKTVKKRSTELVKL